MCDAACGGQILATGEVLALVGSVTALTHHPRSVVLHLGRHRLDALATVELMCFCSEGMLHRSLQYPPPRSEEELTLGYFAAPPRRGVTICFMFMRGLPIARTPEEVAVKDTVVGQVSGMLLNLLWEHKGCAPTPASTAL